MTQDRSKQMLVVYKAGVKIAEGALGTKLTSIAGIAAGTSVADGDYQAAYTDGVTESDKVDVPAFTVPIINVSGITMNDAINMQVGENQTLNIEVQPANATDKTFSISSDNPTVAEVDEEGTILPHKAGTANITVTSTDGGKTATTKVTVTDKVVNVTGVTMSQQTGTMKVGDTKSITGTVTPDNATNSAVSYSSSNATVATVDSDGLITAIAEGTADIIATSVDGGFTGKVSLTVNPAA